jgi:hypothetical protein
VARDVRRLSSSQWAKTPVQRERRLKDARHTTVGENVGYSALGDDELLKDRSAQFRSGVVLDRNVLFERQVLDGAEAAAIHAGKNKDEQRSGGEHRSKS